MENDSAKVAHPLQLPLEVPCSGLSSSDVRDSRGGRGVGGWLWTRKDAMYRHSCQAYFFL